MQTIFGKRAWVAAVLAMAMLLSGCGYNAIQQKDEAVKAGWSEVLNQYQRRADLVPNLVNTVKGYAAHEQETLQQVINARQAGQAASTAGEMAAADSAMRAALGKIFALAEAYPDLKANTNFLQLQQELSAIEDKLAAARRFYNSAVQDYNTAREQFPGSIIAGSFNFEARDFFDVGAGNRAALEEPPAVSFKKS